MKNLLLFIRLSRPLFLLGGILLYALGAGIVHYIGVPINWGVYIIGQLWGLLIQLSTHYLNEYFDSYADNANPNRTPFSGGSGAIGPGKLNRSVALWSAVTCLALAASFTVLLIQYAHLTPVTLLIMGMIFLGAFFYAVPPVRLESTGYGELATSIIVANLVPAFAYALQVGELHRLLAMCTFPLTFLHMAMLIAFELPDYGTDVKYEKRTILVRIGWQQGMRLHNFLILGSYLLLAVAAAGGLSIKIVLPAFITLPIGILQIWSMNRIAAGAKPHWFALTLTALVLFGFTSYFITFAFWI